MASSTRNRTNLPRALTSFVGREPLLGEVVRLLRPDSAAAPLLTLTGAGGSGKTRLALHAAAGLVEDFEDGVWLVSLAPISDPGLVARAIAQTAGVRDAGAAAGMHALKRHFAERQVLLILDNFEQVVAAAGELADLLAACPRLQVLVTSRSALRISAERELAIPPLELSDAVRLFVDRANAVNSDFALNDATSQLVADVCRKLDGLPLAIELAAARMRLLDLPALHTRLEHRLQFLTSGARDLPTRQRTLRGTIAWSYDLLDDGEKALFRAVAVFVGGCSLEAARAVWTADGDILECIESLVAKSLLRPVVDAPGDVRVSMLETTREFGLEQLAWAGELEHVRRAHAAYFVTLAEHAEPRLWGPSAAEWHARLELEHDNLRAALEWASSSHGDGDAQIAQRLAGALARFWWTRSYHREGLQRTLRALAAGPTRCRGRMKALYGGAWLAHMVRDSSAARALLDEGLSIARDIDDEWSEAWILHVLGRLAYFDNDSEGASAYAQQALAIAERLEDESLIGWCLHLQGLAAHVAGDFAAADALYARSMTLRQRLGHREQMAVLSHLMGLSRHRQGDFAEARRLYREYLEISRELGSTFHLNNVLALLGSLAAGQAQPERAARLIGAATSAFAASQTRPIPLTEGIVDEGVCLARASLGERAFESAWAIGSALSSDEAIADALEVSLASGGRGSEGARRSSRAQAGPLSERELQVARLVARGLTNRQIAAELIVSTRTVEAHIEHILNKLNFASRTQIGVWAADRGST